MKARSILFIWSILLFPVCVSAQTDTVRSASGRDPFYLQAYIGINKSANENLPWTEFSRYPFSGGLFAGIGQEFTPLVGWRAAFRFNHNKSRNVQVCESPDTWGWNNTALFADLTFDISDLLRRKNRETEPFFNLKAFAGAGVAYTFGFDKVPLSYTHPYLRSSRILPGARAGLTATFRLSDNWRVGAELSHNIYEDHFNGVACDFPLDSRTNLKVGVTYLFAKKKKPAKEVLRLNRLKECPPLPLMMPDPEPVKVRRLSGRAFLDFPVNETVIYPDYRKNPDELARIKATVDSAVFDQSITVTSISLHGYASPESPYSNNTRLASGRANALKTYLLRYYHFPDTVFSIEFTPEDWGNLRGFLEKMEDRRVKGDFWYDSHSYVETPEAPAVVHQYRDELLSVIDLEMDPDEKEQLLKRVGGGAPYQWLLKYVYPGLRHTDYIIEYEVRAYEVKDGKRLIYKHPEALSLNEMCQVAMSYREGSENWLDALFIAAQQYPDSEIANYNAACACVMTKRFGDARKYLQKVSYSEQVQYITDVILAMEGRVKWRMERGKVVIQP